MSWAAQITQVALETFAGAFPGEVAMAAAAVASDGEASARSPGCPADGRFELGSLTKPMTATLLAALAGAGVVSLDDKIGHWLEAGDNGSITLAALATHSSGLPRLAPGMERDPRFDPTNPYAALGPAEAERALREAARETVGRVAYSNFGFQLLGLALERAAGIVYGELLADQLLAPLGMTRTGVGAGAPGTRLAGHAGGQEVGHWEQPLPAAGGVEAAADDLLRFLAACLHPPASPLGEAIGLAQLPRLESGGDAIGLAWQVRAGRWRWHNGGTGGFASAIGIDPLEGRAFGLLASAREAGGTLEAAVAAALEGGDLSTAHPAARAARTDARARELAAALLDGAFEAVHAQLTPSFAAAVDSAAIRRAWQRTHRGLGAAGEVSVECRTLGSAGAGALVTVAFTGGTLSFAAAFDPAGSVAGLKLLRPGEGFPW